MARRFVRVDLSDTARDFRPVAIEPGLPLLDRASANGRLWFKWLGGLVAEPEWDGESVSFFVQDDHGGRLEDAVCQPASDEDLAGLLKDDLALLRERLAKAKAESSSERLVLKKLREDFAALADDPDRLDRDCHFFRFRDVQHRWRLVWCPGFQRRDAEAAQAVICTDPDCNLLFVRRPGGSARCPGCRAALLAAAPSRRGRRWAALLVLLIAAALAWWLLYPRGLNVSPDRLELAVGQTRDLEIESRSLWPIQVGSSDAAVVAVDPERRLTARAPGSTGVEVRQAWLTRRVDVRVNAPPKEEIAVASPPAPKKVPPGPDKPPPGPIEPAKPVEPIQVVPAPVESRGAPTEVVIASDQGDTVRFPVGAEFGDFRVEARYSDGFTQIVTRRASLRTAEEPAAAPVSFSSGRMLGLRPGKTTVQAEYAGVAAKRGLGVEVTPAADVDEIRLTPSPASLLPGESITLEAVGYKGGKSVGAITGLAGIGWKSSDEQVVLVAGPVATAVKSGQAAVTAQLGPLTSQPAQLSVVAAIADALRVEPGLIRLRVGESLRIGSDVSVFRGPLDVSPRCTVAPAAPSVVRYDADTHSLVGVAPGTTAVHFGRGDKMASAVVEVIAAAFAEGRVVIEPGAETLSPGQAVMLRVFLVGTGGSRIDRTGSAKLASSAPDKVQVSGDWACALAPGSAEITATLPESKAPGRAAIAVDNSPITELIVEPSHIEVAVGDRARLRVLGRSASGIHELFPQDELNMTCRGTNPNVMGIVGSQHVEGYNPGTATVEVEWAGKFKREVSVTVFAPAWSGLAIDPAAATIHPGQAIAYTVTGVRGGQRRVVRPEDGLKLSVADPSVAQVSAGNVVRGAGAGQTRVVAQLGAQTAEAPLSVAPGSGLWDIVVDTPGPAVIVTSPDGTADLVGRHGVIFSPWDPRLYSGGSIIRPSVEPRSVTAIPPSDTLWLEPPRASVALGATTPRFVVMAQSLGNPARQIPATIESTNRSILEPAGAQPGRFVARQMGSTQVRARVGDRELYADVTVSGARFDTIQTSILAPTDKDFAVRAEITAAGVEGPLEYRVYVDGQGPSGPWVPARLDGSRRRVVLEGPRLPIGPPSKFYTLMFEARDPGAGTVQQYPFTFRLAPTIERAEK